ncbi:MAG: hypothetical protein AAGG01_13450, partial [Planctomycetota bacterium]
MAPPLQAPTPQLDRLLRRLGSTLRRNIWLHGLGTAVAAAAAWLTFMYVADRVLRLPAPIRIIHLVVLVGGTLWILSRALLRHVRAVPDRAGLAMLAQRALPDDVPHDDRFVSAIQLRETTAADDPSAPLVERVARDAEAFVPKVDMGRITTGRGPAGRVAVASVAAATLAVSLGYEPAMASIFGARMLGQNVPWPRKTTLVVDVPDAAGALDIDRSVENILRVRAARGSDVPVVVTATGLIPEIVTIRFESGAAIDISASGENTFRTMLPSVQEDIELRAFGGDDQRGAQTVMVEVLQPPDLSSLAFLIEPPTYSGLPARTERDTNVSVLAGSSVSVIAQTDPQNAVGIARTFPDGEEIALERVPFPVAAAQEGAADTPGAPAITGLGFDSVVFDSLRFRFEITDETGLSNPDPALFGIEVVPDRRPELLTLEPGRAEVETIAGAAIPLRVLVRDDFGLDEFRYEVRDLATDEVLVSLPLSLGAAPESVPEGLTDQRRRSARATGLASVLLEVNELQPDALLEEGQVVALQTFITDTRVPDPGETRSSPARIRIVSADEFLRQQRDGLGRAAEDVGQVDSALASVLTRLDEFNIAMDGDDAEAPEPSDVIALMNDTRRMQGDLQTIGRDIASLASSMIYSRMDDRSGVLEARLFELTSTSTERSFQPETWRTLSAEAAAGQLGAPERAGDLLRLVGLALLASGEQSDDVL